MIKITAKEGYTYTQAKEDTPIQNKIFSKELYLGINDDPINWIEITDEYAEQLQLEQERFYEEHLNDL